MQQDPLVSPGAKICWLLLFTFVALKLAGVVGWSWWVVLLPLWVFLGVSSVAVLFWLFLGCLRKR